MTYALLALGRLAEARALIEEYPAVGEASDGSMAAALTVLLAAEGKAELAEKQIAAVLAKESYGHFHHLSFFVACAYARLGNADKALHWLKYTAETGFPNVALFESAPDLAPLRHDARYKALIAHWKKHAAEMSAIGSQ
jgi:hypothetical protein